MRRALWTVVLMIPLGLLAISLFWVASSWLAGDYKDSGDAAGYPISPLANDIWLKDSNNRFLRFRAKAAVGEFETFDLDQDQLRLVSISPDYVVGKVPTPLYDQALVAGKINTNGSIHFDFATKMEFISYDYNNHISSFGNGLFCFLIEHHFDGEGPHEIVSVQLNVDGNTPKFEVKSRLEFDHTCDYCFLFQATRKDTLVFMDRTSEQVDYQYKYKGRLSIVHVANDGTLTYDTIAGFESSFVVNETEFWMDMSEDGRWVATTEVLNQVEEKGDYVLSVVLSELGNGRVVNRYEKRFSFKPPRVVQFPWSISIPIRFDSNHSFLLATPVGFGRFNLEEQGKSPDMSRLKLIPYPKRFPVLSDDGLAGFQGIVHKNGSWFAVRSPEFVKRGQTKVWGADSFVKMK